ncbi:MAG: hypothetical protein ACRCZJ_04530 [Erysipelotrichaceae bacterium]
MLPKYTKRVNFFWWVCATIFFIAITGYVLPYFLQGANTASQQYYAYRFNLELSTQQIINLQVVLGEQGWSQALRFLIDWIFPISYVFYLWTSLVLVLRHQTHPKLSLLLWLPWITLLVDYAQQLAIRWYLYQSSVPIGTLIPYLTQLKWICIYGTFAVLAVGFLYKFVDVQKVRLFGTKEIQDDR